MKNRTVKQNVILVLALIILVSVIGIVLTIIENTGILHSETEMLQMIKDDAKTSSELTVIDSFIAENLSDNDRLPSYDKLLLLCMEEGSSGAFPMNLRQSAKSGLSAPIWCSA